MQIHFFKDSFLVCVWVLWVSIEVWNDFATLNPNTRILIYNTTKLTVSNIQLSSVWHVTSACSTCLQLISYVLVVLDKTKRQLFCLNFEYALVEPLSTCRIDEWPNHLKNLLSTRPNPSMSNAVIFLQGLWSKGM